VELVADNDRDAVVDNGVEEACRGMSVACRIDGVKLLMNVISKNSLMSVRQYVFRLRQD
jgi:hypothetical protein